MACVCAIGILFFVAGPSLVSGCSYVNKLVFSNRCSKDIHLDGWNQNIVAGQTLEITWGRPSGPSSNRIQWKYTDGQQYDFIELNTAWTGPGSSLCGHPSYSNYEGFSMASKYEALDPSNGAFACSDPGAAISCQPSQGPCGAGGGWLCQGSADCTSSYSNWMRNECSHAINPDGTWTPTFKDKRWGNNFPNFWCSGVTEPVATMIDCMANKKPIMFVITTCDVHPNLMGNATVLV